jgi:polyphosphate kinase
VEIKARFDEQANISWARKLEQAGVHVVYGMVGLKTHAKLSLVIRQENEKIRRYGHLGTGNYNPKTARAYEDLGLLTADPLITNDVAYLFNLLSGYSSNEEYDKLLVAPHSVRSGIIKRIKKEIENKKLGKPSGIRIKCNSLVDEQTIDALYDASNNGVTVELVIRGMCALKPGVMGLSENITVRSILGRFLEHSRIYEFANDGNKEVWIGSADLMHRNLDRRVEALVQLEDKEHVSYLSGLLDLYLADNTSHWILDKNTKWIRQNIDKDGNVFQDVQEQLIKRKNLRGLD